MSKAEFWTILLSAVNAFIVLALAGITGWYASSAKRQAQAAEKQASAAGKQAEFAGRTIEFFEGQIKEQSRIAILMLVGSVRELQEAAVYWHGRMTQYGSIKEIINLHLLPNEWTISLERAREISPDLYQQLQNLQRSSRAISRSIEQFSAKDLTYRDNTQAQEIQKNLWKLLSDCTTVFNGLGHLLPSGLINAYLDK